jgi:hypothetical protein
VVCPGEESLTTAIAVQAIEAQPAFGQIKPKRGKVLACLNSILEGDVPAIDRRTQEAQAPRRNNRNPGVQKGGVLHPDRPTTAHAGSPGFEVREEAGRSIEALTMDAQ